MPADTGSPVYVSAVLRACELLRAFPPEGEIARVRELAEQTGLHKATVSRLLATLEKGRLVERVGRRGYRSNVRMLAKRRIRIGYASQTEASLFAHEVTVGIRKAAERQNVDLVVFDNCYDPKTTLQNAERLIAERVDVAIEFQTFESIAQVISSKFQQARTPFISVDLPSPGAIFYGANNYEAGRIAGRAAGRWTRDHWESRIDEVVLINLEAGGPLLQVRLTGALAGLREIFPGVEEAQVTCLEGENTFEGGLRALRRRLRVSRAQRYVILPMNDPNALGAIEAFREECRLEECVVASQGATLDARLELRAPESRLIGSVAYFPERYGGDLVRLALDILERRVMPPAVYTRHRLITGRNVDRLYPDDLRLLK